jgi:hypothetical protein
MTICPEKHGFPAAPPDLQRSLLLNRLLDEGVLILAGKVPNLSTTSVYCVFPKSVLVEVSIDFRNDHSFRTDFVPKR